MHVLYIAGILNIKSLEKLTILDRWRKSLLCTQEKHFELNPEHSQSKELIISEILTSKDDIQSLNGMNDYSKGKDLENSRLLMPNFKQKQRNLFFKKKFLCI